MFQKLFTLYKKSKEWDMGMQYDLMSVLEQQRQYYTEKEMKFHVIIMILLYTVSANFHYLFIPCVRLNFIILKVCALTLPYSSHFTKLNEIVSFKKVIYRVNDINCFVCINTC